MGVIESTIDAIKEEMGGCACIEQPKEINGNSYKEGESAFGEDDESTSSSDTTDGESNTDDFGDTATDGYQTEMEDLDDSEDEGNEREDTKNTGEFSPTPPTQEYRHRKLSDANSIDANSNISNHSRRSVNISDDDCDEHSIQSATATFTQTMDTIPYGGPSAMSSELPMHSPMIEFPISSSSGLDEPIPSDIEALASRRETEEKLPKSSKLIIGLAHLLANILKEYFESEANQCEFGALDVEGILQHVIIVGDAPRDYLLELPMNNTLDIIVDTRELTKLHLQHLQKYHHTVEQQTSYCQCILWNHYLNKFDSENIQKDMKLRKQYNNDTEKIANAMRLPEYISEASYILNGNFFTQIILQSEQFENKLSVFRDKSIGKYPVYQMQIIDELIYGKHNLDGQNFNIFDHNTALYKYLIIKRYRDQFGFSRFQSSNVLRMKQFHSDTRKKLVKYQQQNKMHMFMKDESGPVHQDLHIRLSTRRLNDVDLNGLDAFGTYKLIEFQIPKYKYRVSKCIENYDNTLSFVTLPFSKLVDYFDDGFTFLTVNNDSNKEKSSPHYNEDADELNAAFSQPLPNDNHADIEIDYDWRSKITNGVNNYNAFHDLEKQLITHPNPKKIIKLYKPYIHFWRLIKISILCVGYKIDEKIIKATKEFYKLWIDHDEFLAKPYPDTDDSTSNDSGDFGDSNDDDDDMKDNDNNNNNNLPKYYNLNSGHNDKPRFKDSYGYDELLNVLFDESLCSSWLDYKTMLDRFETLDFNRMLIKKLKRSNDFRQKFVSELNDEDDDVINLFQEYKYPID